MKEKSELLKKIVATIFASINTKNSEKGINMQYTYKSEPVEVKEEGSDEVTKGWEFSIIARELGYKDKVLQSFRFEKPDNITKYNIEYNVFTLVLTTLAETSLITWTELGKSLNKDADFQKEAINSLKDDKEINTDTDKQ
jgi:hypothetical protein